jgi:hypothetical protein
METTDTAEKLIQNYTVSHPKIPIIFVIGYWQRIEIFSMSLFIICIHCKLMTASCVCAKRQAHVSNLNFLFTVFGTVQSVSTWNAAVPFDISSALFQSLISFVIGRIGFMVKVDYVQFYRKLVSFTFVRRSRFKIKNTGVTVVRYWTVLFYFYSFLRERKLCELVCPLQNCDTMSMR